MANRWGIPKEVEECVKERDSKCVYCGVSFQDVATSFGARPSWEHIINDIRTNGMGNIALCCRSCNSSKGKKSLANWLTGPYCSSKGIDKNSVADVVKKHL